MFANKCIFILKVILGGGRAYFTPRTMTDIETGVAGRRRDGQDLIGQPHWQIHHFSRRTGQFGCGRH